jgi:hypothetical protein
MKTYKGLIKSLKPNEIFVFGSNTEGRHGRGAAAVAKQLFGAKNGQTMGLMGQSYGVVTKDLTKNRHPSISMHFIKDQIKTLYKYADNNTHMSFYVAYSAKDPFLSGFTAQQLADMFSVVEIPDNIVFEEGFSKLLTV